MTIEIEPTWRAAATLLANHRDVLDARPAPGETSATLVARGWAAYLLAREDQEIDRLETHGLDAVWPAGAPESLVELSRSVRSVCQMATADPRDVMAERRAQRCETPRKRAQVDAFARVVVPLARAATRVIDVGSGHGHLTRVLADRLGVPVLGLERDAARADRARALAAEQGADASFAVADVLARGLALRDGDCVVGLHACGELGDAMIESAARAGAALALVACCLQKRRALSRAPLGRELDGDHRRALDLPRWVLGLSNLTARNEGVEASRTENLRARERRLALHWLLNEAGIELDLGAEMEGLNRRAAHGPLEDLVARVFGLREIPEPSSAAIEAAARWAQMQHARMRRLALPRSLLARLLEIFVALDRARYLESHGHNVAVDILFPASVSARNLAIFASSRSRS